MGDPEENPSGTGTNMQDKNGNITSDGQNYNNKSNSSSIRGKLVERGNTRINSRSNTVNTVTTSTKNKD